MSITFVNLHGQPVSTAPVKRARVTRDKAETFHKGWRIVGFSLDQIKKAKEIHEKDRAALLDGSKPKDIGPFVLEQYMNKSKPRAVRRKPYEIHSSAVLCMQMAQKEGWLRVQVIELSSNA